MLRFAAVLSLLALLVGASPRVLAQTVGIIPGQALGPYRIGQDAGPIVAGLGPLHTQDDFAGGIYRGYFWPLKRIGVMVETRTLKIAALALLLDDSLRTDKGIAAGNTMDQVHSAYGKEDRIDGGEGEATLVYDREGVAFVMDTNGVLAGRISLIYVFGQGEYDRLFPSDDAEGPSDNLNEDRRPAQTGLNVHL